MSLRSMGLGSRLLMHAAVFSVALQVQGTTTFVTWKPSPAKNISLSEAQDYCETRYEGQLATFTYEDMLLIQPNVQSGLVTGIWVGVAGPTKLVNVGPDDWLWTDNTPFDGSVWAPENPVQWDTPTKPLSCVSLRRNGLVNSQCDENAGIQEALCETEITPTPPTTTTLPPPTFNVMQNGPYTGWVGPRVPSDNPNMRCYYRYYNTILRKVLTNIKRLNWEEARSFCQDPGSTGLIAALAQKTHLASITTEEENDFLVKMLQYEYQESITRPAWIGAKAQTFASQKYSWVDDPSTPSAFGAGETAYNNFGRGEPNNRRSAGVLDTQEDCVQLNHAKNDSPGHWNDAACDRKRGWLCESCWTE